MVGIETNIVTPRLSENFVGMKNSGTIAGTLESNSADKNKFAPVTSSRQQTGTNAVCPEVQDLIGKVSERYSSLIMRGTELTEKIADLYIKANSIKFHASEWKATVDAFNGDMENAARKANVWTEACSGAYNVRAGSYDVDSGGAIEIKGSTVKIEHWRVPGVECAGGKVKDRPASGHLVSGRARRPMSNQGL